jgi:hypothetical protein
MDEPEDVLELERKIAQASRISSRVADPTTYELLKACVEELDEARLPDPVGVGGDTKSK